MNAAPVQFLTATPRRRSNGGGPGAGNESTSRGTRLHSTDRGQDADAFAESLLQRAARLRLPELFGRPRPEAVTGQHRGNRKGRSEMTRRIMQLKRASARTRVSAAEAGRGNYRASLPIAAGAALAMLIALVQAAPIQAASGVGARPLPDLTVSAVSDSPSAIEVGTPFTITATTTNAGKRPAQASLTRFYLSPDAVLGASDVSLSGELAVGKLKKRHSRTASVALTLGATPAPGTYSLLACADDTKLVAESDETDNCRASAGTVSFGPPPDPVPDPDPPPDPDPDPDPPPSGDSSQALIQADLDTGLISYETSLIYRTLALFGDPRLPSRYQAAPSSGEDQALFAEFEANLASLSAEAQTTIEPYLLPPNDPASAWGVQPATVTRAGFAEALAADDPLPFPPDLKCDASSAPHGLDTTGRRSERWLPHMGLRRFRGGTRRRR